MMRRVTPAAATAYNKGLEAKARRRFVTLLGLAALAVGGLSFAAPGGGGAAPKIRIGIVGSGKIGGTLGSLWVKSGYSVMFSSLDLEHDRQLAASLGANAQAGTPRQAAAFGDAVLLAVPYSALPQLGRDLGDLIKGKLVIDACNPIVARDGETATWARGKGAGLASAELLPGARLVRAFNAIAASKLQEAAQRQGEPVGIPLAGDDAAAITAASGLVRAIGFEPVLIGSLAKGRHLIPGTPLTGEHSAEEIRKIAANLD